MEGADGPTGPPRFVYAETPVSDVHVSVEGLRGRLRATALAAADTVCGAPTLGSLDRRLRAAGASLGDTVAIDVSPGPEKGCIHVAFRPQSGLSLATEAGLDRAQLDPTLSLKAEQVVSPDGARPPMRFGVNSLVGLGRDAVTGSVHATPLRLPALGSSVSTTFELAMSAGNLTRLDGPGLRGQLGALSLSDPTGKHSVRLEAASRELFPTEGSSQAVLDAPLRSTKTSVSYQLLHDGRQDSNSGLGELRKGTLEVAGLLGDVALAKASCIWAYSRRLFGGTCSISAALGLAVPLAEKEATTPYEDRFWMGGALGGPPERLPGFASFGGIGPTDARKATGNAALPGQLRKVFRFGKDWQTEAGVAAPGAAEAAPEAALEHIGGDARASIEAKLQWPIYVPLAGGLQLHWLLFGSAGSLVGRVGPQLPQDFAAGLRASVGAGVGTPLPGGGFLGVTCAQPLLAKSGDEQQRLQLWLSLGSLL